MGTIYNWFAVETGKLAPIGWHVPTNAEWEELLTHLGGEYYTKLLSAGTNASGFSAGSSPILCGWGFGPEISYWSATSYQNPDAFVPYAYYFTLWKQNDVEKATLFTEPQSFGFCVRCIKD